MSFSKTKKFSHEWLKYRNIKNDCKERSFLIKIVFKICQSFCYMNKLKNEVEEHIESSEKSDRKLTKHILLTIAELLPVVGWVLLIWDWRKSKEITSTEKRFKALSWAWYVGSKIVFAIYLFTKEEELLHVSAYFFGWWIIFHVSDKVIIFAEKISKKNK